VANVGELIDWWTVRGERWGVLNLDFKVELTRESGVRPHRLTDYGEAELDAFDGGDWQFTRIRMVPVSRDLVDLIGAQQTLSHVEWGEMPGGRIDREQVTDEQVLELARCAVGELRRLGMPVESEPGSELSMQATAAPF
jgi:hypothetical protein